MSAELKINLPDGLAREEKLMGCSPPNQLNSCSGKNSNAGALAACSPQPTD